MSSTRPSDSRPHLLGGLAACLLAVALLASAAGYSRWREKRSLNAVAPELFQAKNQGVVLAQAAMQNATLLPVYGGSELQKDAWGRAPVFFEKAPTGFAVFAIGKEGTMPLNMLHRVAALGDTVRGKKVVVLLSPTWFLRPTVHPRFYEGNFSTLQAQEFAFNSRIDFALKQEVARHMLEYPSTLWGKPLLRFAVRRLASGTILDRVLYTAAIPLARLENAVLRMQDHLETMSYLRATGPVPAPFHIHERPLDWRQLFADAERKTYNEADADPKPEKAFHEIETGGDAAFADVVAKAHEWSHLDLLFRTLSQLGAKPLLLSPPLNGPYLDRIGIAPGVREGFYTKLQGMAAQYGFALIDFQGHEEDPKFLADRHDHPSVRGWMYYNAALDGFYHGKPMVSLEMDAETKKLGASPAP